ncbi:GDSL esterase/lipase [Melia azedarach]|uniref:GDSL esterase/lipase n=1 Tax=Melia azedarach TaxID=155640 RepID=A0ACC1X6Y8_MELAZ|nr:GDSL esterase/lipase [Melia azedarach]
MSSSSSSKSSAIISFNINIILFIISLHFLPFMVSSADPRAPALYVFGDSLFDSGNNNFLPTIAKADYSPYGANFVKNSTGRFTNGRTVADFIAEFLGLPYSPPFLKLRDKLPLTGLNYASGSCGILPDTGHHHGKCLNIEEQVGLFKETIKLLLKHFKSPQELSNYLWKSIFIISIGSNDYLSNYQDSDTNKRNLPQDFAKLLVNKLSGQFERLYNLGARKIVMFEIGPIGCIPSITRKTKHNGQCVEEKNKLVSVFNNLLPPMLQNLTSTLKGSTFVYGHVNPLGYDAALNPSKYGLEDATNPCCITWLNGTSGCIPFLKPCRNADKHYFWDGYHLTEAVYSVLASQCINDKSVCIPFNLNDLVYM